MGEPNPAHVGRVDHRRQVLDEGAISEAQAGVDDHRLRSVQDEGVDREVADAWDLLRIGQDGDPGNRAESVHLGLLANGWFRTGPAGPAGRGRYRDRRAAGRTPRRRARAPRRRLEPTLLRPGR